MEEEDVFNPVTEEDETGMNIDEIQELKDQLGIDEDEDQKVEDEENDDDQVLYEEDSPLDKETYE